MGDVSIEWAIKVLLDLESITEYYLDHSDAENAARRGEQLLEDIDKIANTPFLGRRQAGLNRSYQFWLAINNQYRVYFRRLDANTIKIYRIWPAKSKPLKPKDIYE